MRYCICCFSGDTALIVAARNGLVALVQLLCKSACSVSYSLLSVMMMLMTVTMTKLTTTIPFKALLYFVPCVLRHRLKTRLCPMKLKVFIYFLRHGTTRQLPCVNNIVRNMALSHSFVGRLWKFSETRVETKHNFSQQSVLQQSECREAWSESTEIRNSEYSTFANKITCDFYPHQFSEITVSFWSGKKFSLSFVTSLPKQN